MSLIAGYVSDKHKLETVHLEKTVKRFSALTHDQSDDYKSVVIETKFGHIIQKCKSHYPIQYNPCRDMDGNILVSIGYVQPSEFGNTHQKLFELCIENKTDVLEECEGEYVSIFTEGHSGKVHIINDRYASRPFYVLHDADGIFFSSNLAFLLCLKGGKHGIDVIGWLQIFSYGHTLGSRTTFKKIKRIPPAVHLTILPNSIEEKRYWNLEHIPEYDLSPLEYSTKVFEAFKAGAEKRAKLFGKGIVPLSGGLDSRLVAGALPQGASFSAFTFVDSKEASNTAEVAAAAEVSNVLGLEHHIEQLSNQQVSQVADDVVMLTGGLIPIHHPAKVMTFVNHIIEKDVSYLLGGGPATLAGGFIPSINYIDPNRMTECIHDFCDKRTLGGKKLLPLLTLLLREDIVREYFASIKTSMLETLEEIVGPTPAHRVTAWGMLMRQPAFTFASPIHNHPDVTEAFSHLDYKYCDLMLKIPADWLYKKNFYAFMIYRCLPQLQHIVYSNTGNPLPGQLLHFDGHSTHSPGYLSRAQQLISRTKRFSKRFFVRRSDPPPYPFHYSLLQRDDRLFLELNEIIHSSTSLQSILDVERCGRFLSNFRKGKLQAQHFGQDAELLGSLATICYSFKNFNCG